MASLAPCARRSNRQEKRRLDDIFAVQEELTHGIVAAIAPQIEASELAKARRRRPGSAVAYEIAMCARSKVREAHLKANRTLREEAIADARAALAIDPDSTAALIALALAQWQHVAYATVSDRQAAWEEGMLAATRAIELDHSDAWGYGSKGLLLVHAVRGDRTKEALRNLRRAYELNPHDSAILAGLGLAETVAGTPNASIGRLEKELRWSPRDLSRHALLLVLTICCLGAREYEKGVEYGSRGVDEYPESGTLHLNLAMCLVGNREFDKAHSAVEDARRCEPELVQRWSDGKIVFRRPEDLHRIRTFLRVAMGLDDPSAAEAVR